MKNFEFSKYCTPAQLYLVIGVICIITGFFANYSIEMLLTKGLFLVVWAWVLNWLCSKGFKAISWIIVLLPFIFFLFMYFLIKDVAVKEGFTLPGGAVKAAPGSGGGGIQQLTPQAAVAAATQGAIEDTKKRQADAQAQAEQMRKDIEAKVAAAAAAQKAADEKAAAEKAVADAQAAKDAADKVAADKAAVLAKCMADRDAKCQGAKACLRNTKC
jgi:hypothetical protein